MFVLKIYNNGNAKAVNEDGITFRGPLVFVVSMIAAMDSDVCELHAFG